MKVRIKKGYPPNIDAIRKVFPLSGGEIFAWNLKEEFGGIIFNPQGFDVPAWLVAHEKVHFRQQARHRSTEDWWAQYLVDTEWRLEQELEAHQVEYRSFCRSHLDRNVRTRFLRLLAQRLSAPMYGSIITAQDAIKRIRGR